jgi:hypothetical protein
MVKTIKADRGPLIKIHYIERAVSGSGIAVKVYGELKCTSKEVIYAKELGLNTLEVLLLTAEAAPGTGYYAQKYIVNKGEYNNYASIDIWNNAGSEVTSSVWLNFLALGE